MPKPDAGAKHGGMKNIVALVDFSDVTDRVIEQARQMAVAFEAKLILLHAVPTEPVVVDLGLASPTFWEPPSEKHIEADYEKLLTLRDKLTDSGVEVAAQQLEEGSVGGVLDESLRLNADLIIVGAHHHSTLYQLFVGTLTQDLLKRAPCPVLVVPSAAQ